MVTYPSEFGTVVRDLSSDDVSDPSKKELYVIETDDNPRDFSAPVKIYGAFWSSRGPAPVNEIAVGLWSKFGDPDRRDCQDNVDGTETGEGDCYRGSACLGYGSSFLSVSVQKLDGERPRLLKQVYDSGLLEEAMAIVNISIDKGMADAFDQLNAPPWLRELGALDPIYGVFGYPENNVSKENVAADGGELLAFLSRIVRWRPEKEGKRRLGQQFVVAQMRFDPSVGDPKEFFRRIEVDVHGPNWENEANEDGFATREKALVDAMLIRDECGEFKDYEEQCPELAMTYGPFDSREMMIDSGVNNDAKHCRVEVMTKVQFACFLHNLMVKAGLLHAPMYMSPPAPFDWCQEIQGRLWLEPARSVEAKMVEEQRKKIGAQFGVIKFTYPRSCPRIHLPRRVAYDFYGPNGNVMGDDEPRHFLTKEEAVRYAKEKVRDASEWFAEYSHRCSEKATSDGPWLSEEMENGDDDCGVWVEVITVEEFACFSKNMMVSIGMDRGRMIPSPPAPAALSKFMGW